jgi:thioredoxin-dependent peroxiredoxin
MKTFIFFLSFSLFAFHFSHTNAQIRELTIGDSVPQFSLKDQNDSMFNTRDFIGKKLLVIYFYPKDESMVCTKEACAFRDKFNDFTKAGAMVIGINYGTVESHKKFSEKDKLPFTLLSDPDKKVMKLFGIKGGIGSGRDTYVIDLSGQIVFTYNSVMHGAEHAEKALEYIRQVKK